jgi:4-hydroxy-2-oxoheptanedioate aldolase
VPAEESDQLLRERWAGDEVLLGGWLTIPDGFGAQIMAHSGFDWLCVDLQHGLADHRDALAMIHAISAAGAAPIVRVPSLDDGAIGRALDGGARGVIVPMVNTRAAAEDAVAACRYAPAGRRSFGPTKARYQLGVDYYTRADDDVLCIVMVETTEALGNLDAIAGTTGVDAIFVGPSDLSISLGLPPGLDNDAAPFTMAIDSILSACRHHRVAPGIYADAATAPVRARQGFRMIAVANDSVVLANAAAAALDEVRRTIS